MLLPLLFPFNLPADTLVERQQQSVHNTTAVSKRILMSPPKNVSLQTQAVKKYVLIKIKTNKQKKLLFMLLTVVSHESAVSVF